VKKGLEFPTVGNVGVGVEVAAELAQGIRVLFSGTPEASALSILLTGTLRMAAKMLPKHVLDSIYAHETAQVYGAENPRIRPHTSTLESTPETVMSPEEKLEEEMMRLKQAEALLMQAKDALAKAFGDRKNPHWLVVQTEKLQLFVHGEVSRAHRAVEHAKNDAKAPIEGIGDALTQHLEKKP